MVRGIAETYVNLAILLSLIKLDEVVFKVATDFKLLNILLGLSVRDDSVVWVFSIHTNSDFEIKT